jgi:hypothetical protein
LNSGNEIQRVIYESIVNRRCSHSDCSDSATVALEGCGYCTKHFIWACYKHLEKSSEAHIDNGFERNAKRQTDSLVEIVDKVTSLSLNSIAFSNQERGQLMDILLWTCDLLEKQT